MKNFFASFPRWTFTLAYLLVVVWMMDVPTPFMETMCDTFSDFDFAVHIIMAATMVFVIPFDWQRRRQWKAVPGPMLILFTLITLAITGVTEYMQTFTPEEYRRWFDWHDIAAQGIGAVAMGVVYSFLQLLWCKKNIPEKA